MEKEYKYDAFISYRHTDLDKYVAENLHKVLETYELPKNIKEKLNINGRTIKRVFRDQDELPLSSNLEDPILEALNNSKYLIVICSPRLKESLWCKKEIETFKKIRGRENIFCVLIEGEPDESFPDEVLFDEVKTKDKNGKEKITKEYYEPLAADVRGLNKKEVLKRIKTEKLRLIAPMYNLDYDDLKQRHKQRKMKKMITTSIIAASVFFVIALYSSLMLIKINKQQKTLKLHQAEALVNKSEEYLEKDSKREAVKAAYSALTKFKNVKMPYTSAAEYALVESLGVYDAGTTFKALDELKTKGVIDYIKVSFDNKYALTIDESEEITLWNIDNLKKIKSFNDINILSTNDKIFTFVGTDKFAYISKNGSVKILSIKNGKLLKEIKKKEYSYSSIDADINGKYIAVNDSPNLYLYNAEDYELINKYSIDKKDRISDVMKFTSDSSTLFITSSEKNYDINKSVKSKVHVLKTKDLSLKDSFNIDGEYFTDIKEKGNNIYLIINKSISIKSYMNVISYDYKENKLNFNKNYGEGWGKFILPSFYEESKSLALVHGNVIEIINISTGDKIASYTTSSDIIGIYSYTSSDIFVVFASDGSVNFLNIKDNLNFKNPGLFELNLDNYNFVIRNNNGYLLVPKYENRIIYYENSSNNKIKEVDLKLDYPKDEGIKLNEYEKIKKEYNLKKKNLVKKIIYADDKKVLIASYNDNTASIYNVKSKKYITTISNVDEIYHYFGKDKYNRIYVGSLSNTYILDKDYNKVGHIKSMAKLDKKNNKVIISNSDKYYSLPIYDLNSLLTQAKKYLNK